MLQPFLPTHCDHTIRHISSFFPFDTFADYFNMYFAKSLSNFVLNISYSHMAALALNRFHAVFFLFSYQRLWKMRYIIIKYLLLLAE